MATPKKPSKKPARKKAAAKKSKPARAKAKAKAGSLSVDDVVARDLPGWRISTASQSVKQTVSDGANLKTRKGPSISQLRAKFLGAGAKDASGGAEPGFAPLDSSVKTVRVEPKSGGPAKTAAVKTNKIESVPGSSRPPRAGCVQ
jgi:hypothetical protein